MGRQYPQYPYHFGDVFALHRYKPRQSRRNRIFDALRSALQLRYNNLTADNTDQIETH
jgi:hypothetical protein